MIKAIIIDDHPHAVNSLMADIQQHCLDVEIAATAGDVKEGLKIIETYSPDLVFLDVEMPGNSGFDLLKHFPQANFEVIFVTAFSDFAIKGIKTDALDYLLKPVDPEELTAALNKYRKKKAEVNYNKKPEDNSSETCRLAIPVNGSIIFIDSSDILYCEADGSYTRLFTKENSYMICRNLKDTESCLPDYFMRIHNSFTVNTRLIVKYERGEGGMVSLVNGKSIPVAKKRKDALLKKLNVQ